jgi:uncharacterized repeat protein (TIGR03843 family)
LVLLRDGDVDIDGRMPWSSNATFLATVRWQGHEAKAIYKPVRGERPLWDFPTGLHRREVAAWMLSEWLGFGFVPPTVERDGPFGVGSLQLFVPSDFEQHYFTLYEGRADLHDQLQAICAFDLVINNTDRKSGHCLLDADGNKVWAIDHGLCFAVPFKLRTVIWEFAGGRVPVAVLDKLTALCHGAPATVADLLDDDEVDALVTRARALVARPVFPIDASGHRYPWPLV